MASVVGRREGRFGDSHLCHFRGLFLAMDGLFLWVDGLWIEAGIAIVIVKLHLISYFTQGAYIPEPPSVLFPSGGFTSCSLPFLCVPWANKAVRWASWDNEAVPLTTKSSVSADKGSATVSSNCITVLFVHLSIFSFSPYRRGFAYSCFMFKVNTSGNKFSSRLLHWIPLCISWWYDGSEILYWHPSVGFGIIPSIHCCWAWSAVRSRAVVRSVPRSVAVEG